MYTLKNPVSFFGTPSENISNILKCKCLTTENIRTLTMIFNKINLTLLGSNH